MDSNDLAIYGYKGKGIEEFHVLMADVYYGGGYYETFKTVERLLCNPKAAIVYVDEVLCKVKFSCPYNELLEELLKIRKNGVLDDLKN